MPVGAFMGGWIGAVMGSGNTILSMSLAELLFDTIGLMYSPVRLLLALPAQVYV